MPSTRATAPVPGIPGQGGIVGQGGVAGPRGADPREPPVVRCMHGMATAAEQAFPACHHSWAVPSGLDGANGADRQHQVPMNGRCRYPRVRETSG